MNIKLNGKAKWAMVRKPEVFQGQEVGYSICLEMPQEKLEAYKKAMEQYFHDELETGTLKGKRINPKVPMHMGVKEDNEGNEMVKAKTKTFYIDKSTGERVNKTIPIFDKYGRILDENILIGNGSDVQVACEARPYVVRKDLYGIALYLKAVQVVNLVEYNSGGGEASAYGFDVVDLPKEEETAEYEEVEF